MVSPSRSTGRIPFIMSVREHIRWDMERLAKIVRKLELTELAFTAEDIIEEFRRYSSDYSLTGFMHSLIDKMKRNGRVRTAETYKAALNSFKCFLATGNSDCPQRRRCDIMLDCIDSDLMEAYEAWNVRRGVTPNTISFYNRILRAVYNRAVEDNVIECTYPFRHVYTGISKTVKRALPLAAIRKIKELDLSANPNLDYARDMFLLSFMLRGMSFIDMAYLTKADRINGYITYRRRKTGQRLVIKWTKEMQSILDKYPENCTRYLLPIIRKNDINERSAYRNMGCKINHCLKTIGTMVGIKIPLTLYVARHSWASAAKEKGIPLNVISEGMGHDSETTTLIYLASLDTTVVDRANSIILRSI